MGHGVLRFALSESQQIERITTKAPRSFKILQMRNNSMLCVWGKGASTTPHPTSGEGTKLSQLPTSSCNLANIYCAL